MVKQALEYDPDTQTFVGNGLQITHETMGQAVEVYGEMYGLDTAQAFYKLLDTRYWIDSDTWHETPQTLWDLLAYLYYQALFEMSIFEADVIDVPQINLDLDPSNWCGLCTIDINDKSVCLWDPDHRNNWAGYAIVDLYLEGGYAKHLWHELRRLMYEKNYTYYWGYNGRNIAIIGHPDGWPSVWPGTSEYLGKAITWLKNQPQGESSEERLERKMYIGEEMKLLAKRVPDTF